MRYRVDEMTRRARTAGFLGLLLFIGTFAVGAVIYWNARQLPVAAAHPPDPWTGSALDPGLKQQQRPLLAAIVARPGHAAS